MCEASYFYVCETKGPLSGSPLGGKPRLKSPESWNASPDTWLHSFFRGHAKIVCPEKPLCIKAQVLCATQHGVDVTVDSGCLE